MCDTPVVYGVFRGQDLVHIGEGDSIQRPAGYVQEKRNEGVNGLTVKYVEVTRTLVAQFPLPTDLNASTLFQGNLERLLQASYVWAYGKLPDFDRIRGGKGSVADTTGGFVQSLEVLARVFDLLELIHPPTAAAIPWPIIAGAPPETLPPNPKGGRGRPPTRDHHLAFWVVTSKPVAFVGHLPVTKMQQPHYAAATKVIHWHG